jgi:surface antigen
MAGQDTYTFGNCTWYVAGALGWVRGGWGNATDWAASAARAGFQLTNVPTPGAVVVYQAGAHYSSFGHVAIVQAVYGPASFLVSEMNFIAFDTVDQRVSNLADVEAFILPPGVPAGSGVPAGTGSGAGTPDVVRVEWAALQQLLNQDLEGQLARLGRARAAILGIAS